MASMASTCPNHVRGDNGAEDTHRKAASMPVATDRAVSRVTSLGPWQIVFKQRGGEGVGPRLGSRGASDLRNRLEEPPLVLGFHLEPMKRAASAPSSGTQDLGNP